MGLSFLYVTECERAFCARGLHRNGLAIGAALELSNVTDDFARFSAIISGHFVAGFENVLQDVQALLCHRVCHGWAFLSYRYVFALLR